MQPEKQPPTTTSDPEYLRERLHLLEETYRATINILEDVNEERNKLDATRSALTNILEDVETERIRAEEARALLESVNKELEAFSYSVSHDLRAPLRAISGFAEAVIEDYEPRLDAEGKRYLTLIKENAHKMGQLVDDLLSFSRLGRQELIKTEINMESLAKLVFEELYSQVSKRDIQFIIHSAPNALGDTATIQQVLVNLFSNAIKFTRTRPKALIEFGFQPAVGSHPGAYYIKDNGVGFEMQYVNKLFGVFQRLHAVTEFEGTGIGLALVSRIVSRHGGQVWAESTVQEGATFYFSLTETGKTNKIGG
ncbi:MAG: ATP-binding protein [bacterium]|nr:ATP-binding protein [bacterium]